MSNSLTIVIIVCLAGLFVGISYRSIRYRRWKRLVLSVAVMGIVVFSFNRAFAFPRIIETKGPVSEWIALVVCYICMVIGMVSQYFYSQGEERRTEFKFEFTWFIMPILASPIVFIPLLALLEDLPVGGMFTKSKLMIYFVSFQNGFFWKDFFERQRQKLSGVPSEAQART